MRIVSTVNNQRKIVSDGIARHRTWRCLSPYPMSASHEQDQHREEQDD
jgi:hypothetical protein